MHISWGVRWGWGEEGGRVCNLREKKQQLQTRFMCQDPRPAQAFSSRAYREQLVIVLPPIVTFLVPFQTKR